MSKRIFDLLFSTIGIIMCAPVFMVLALVIKLESDGPVFYRGVRVGKGGRSFRVLKFRSMVVNAEILGGSSTSSSDSRITRVGKLLRKYKLDELPQLINVFLGDMSFVGPRPQVQWAVELYNVEERQLLQLRPGITDWASIKFHDEGGIIGKSGIADADVAYMKLIHPEKMRLQIKYLKERSLWVDVKILIQTLSAIFTSRFVQDERHV